MTTNQIKLSSDDLIRINQIIMRANAELRDVVKDNNVVVSVVFPQMVSLKVRKDGVFTNLNYSEIMKEVVNVTRISEVYIKSESRKKDISTARHIFFHLAYKAFGIGSLKDVALYVNRDNHSTVISACEKVDELLVLDEDFLMTYKQIYFHLYEMEYGRKPDWKQFYKTL